MSQIFKWVDSFFASLEEYIGLEGTSVVCIGLFLLIAIISFIATSHSYEAKLVKAIDMLNGYFINNPKITEDNLVLFNQIMRHNKVPKLLRKYWQQFMLYREHNASYYMSFENCVVIPLRNSKFKRDKIIMNLFAYILAAVALILSVYLSPTVPIVMQNQSAYFDIALLMRGILLAPIIILLLNFILSIVLDLKESAIINDLNQNYQYFEANIDKATKTLPDYVDYEILFDKQEIKKGIPVLYQYLQKRAEDEQRELELARLKNVEHEKFDFDKAGLAGSLVLERAMQEAENYIAERKKYNQDIEQINSEMAQEDLRYRESTKEYNRQMQVSKETFANFKQELEEATSTIQANYLKKQQQQELDRQRNLERDFDTATDRHKKVIESYQAELDSIDEFIANSRKSLQDAMMAEFATYSSKVYDEVKKVVEEREKDKYEKIKQEIKKLEEELYIKSKQPLKVEEQPEDNGANKVDDNLNFEPAEKVETDFKLAEEPVEENIEKLENNNFTWNSNEEDKIEEATEEKSEENEFKWNFDSEENVEKSDKQNDGDFETMSLADFDQKTDENNNDQGYQSYSDFLKNENLEPFKLDSEENSEAETEDDWLNEEFKESTVQKDESTQEGENIEEESSEEDDDFSWFDEILQESNEDEEDEEGEEPLEIKPEPVIVKKKAGRPRKIVSEVEDKPKRKAGRPRKIQSTEEIKPKAGRGRPRKVESVKVEEPKRKAGRPKKIEVKTENVTVGKPKAGRGRPKKIVSVSETAEPKRGRGRPKKKKAGRPRKVETNTENIVEAKPKAGRGRPKKQVSSLPKVSKDRGRPKKVDLNSVDENVDLEAYLKVIDNAIAKENAKIKKTQKALEDNATLNSKKKK